jgi:hypothetical protein
VVAGVRERLRAYLDVLPWLERLEHPQAASLLLSRCLAARPSYLLRLVAPSPAVLGELEEWDSELLSCLDRLLGGIQLLGTDDQSRRAALQVSLPVRRGGFGLRRAAVLAAPSYLTSWVQCSSRLARGFEVSGQPLFRAAFESGDVSLLSPGPALARALLPECALQFVPTWTEAASFSPSASPLGRGLCAALVRSVDQARGDQVRELLRASPWQLSYFASLQGPHAGACLQAVPSEDRLTLSPAQFRSLARLRLFRPEPSLVEVPRCRCGRDLSDPCDRRHALRCVVVGGALRAHTEVLEALEDVARRCGLRAVREVSRLLPSAHRRMDLVVRQGGGRVLLYDAVVADPQAPSSSRVLLRGGDAARTAERAKVRKYGPEVSLVPGAVFSAVGLEVAGSLGPSACQVLRDWARTAAAERQLSGSVEAEEGSPFGASWLVAAAAQLVGVALARAQADVLLAWGREQRSSRPMGDRRVSQWEACDLVLVGQEA